MGMGQSSEGLVGCGQMLRVKQGKTIPVNLQVIYLQGPQNQGSEQSGKKGH